MKKILYLVISILAFCTIAFAQEELGDLIVKKLSYPIFYNDTIIATELPSLSVNGNAYVPLREICNIFDIDISWDAKRAEIILSDNINELEIVTTEETAIEIAKAAIKAIYNYNYDMKPYKDEGFSYKAEFNKETELWKVYGVFPSEGYYVGGVPTVIISKSGEVVSINHTK